MFVPIAARRGREDHDPARRAAQLLASISLGSSLFPLAACAAPERHAASFESTARAVETRVAGPAELERALEIAALAPLSLSLPDEPARLDPARDEFWHAGALAWNASVRGARRRFLGARARARSEGAPEPLAAEVVRIEDDTKVKASLDLLGVLGLGAARAARELASEEARLAFAEYETSVWNAWIDVDRARVELGSRRAELAALDELAAENQPLVRRREILAARGFVPAATIDASRVAETMLETERSSLRTSIAGARETLALAAGLAPAATALDAVDGSVVAALAADEPRQAPPAEVLWNARPEVRAMRVRCALAGAALERAFAERLPMLRLGFESMLSPADVLAGPMVELALAHPGARDGRIEAARQECEAMREAVEDALLAALARAHTAAVQWAEASRLHHGDLDRLERDSRAGWTAARARFLNEPQAVDVAAAMLAERVKAIRMVHDHDRALALAALEFRRAAGAVPEEVRP